MVGGFNTNVRYRGRTFHVQTEDSGPNVAKIVTLLYEGGTILLSRKTSYGSEASSRESVRALMEQQHCEMVEALKAGGLDAEISKTARSDGPAEPPTPAQTSSARSSSAQSSPGQTSQGPQAPRAAAAQAPKVVQKRPARTPPEVSRAARPTPRAAPSADSPGRDFGHGIITQKPLDEVVLAHLAPK